MAGWKIVLLDVKTGELAIVDADFTGSEALRFARRWNFRKTRAVALVARRKRLRQLRLEAGRKDECGTLD